MQARLILVSGRIQRHESIIHVVATALEDRSDWLRLLSERHGDMPIPLANADEVKSPGPDPQTADATGHPRWSRGGATARPRPMHPRHERVIPKSRDFH
jgi:error-prone DNA polymerase